MYKFKKASERRICKLLAQPRSTQRYKYNAPADEPKLTKRVIELATQCGRYGYRRITALLKTEGWYINHKRVQRIWRKEGLKAPKKQPKRKRLWLNDGSYIRLNPQYPNHVWSYGFIMDKTHDSRTIKMLTIIDEYTRERLNIDVSRHLKADGVIEKLSELFISRTILEYIRSNNGPEFVSKKIRNWFKASCVKTLYIESGSPWENGYIESFNGKFRDELLNLEIFDTLLEAKILINRWRMEYNTRRPHSALKYTPPAPEAIAC